MINVPEPAKIQDLTRLIVQNFPVIGIRVTTQVKMSLGIRDSLPTVGMTIPRICVRIRIVAVRKRSYHELRRIESFEDRFKYLSLQGQVGESTFGFDRWINQEFYRSRQWKQVRSYVITRDNGCDLGVDGYDIHHGILIHHMNPMTANDISSGDEAILDPEFLITTTHRTHNAIHYGDERLLPRLLEPRRRGDTKLW